MTPTCSFLPLLFHACSFSTSCLPPFCLSSFYLKIALSGLFRLLWPMVSSHLHEFLNHHLTPTHTLMVLHTPQYFINNCQIQNFLCVIFYIPGLPSLLFTRNSEQLFLLAVEMPCVWDKSVSFTLLPKDQWVLQPLMKYSTVIRCFMV